LVRGARAGARWLVLVVALGIVCGAGAGEARADVSDRLRKIGRLLADAKRAKGAEGYTALRKIWAEWDQGDPMEVEDAIRSAADEATASPPLRVYASLLEAYARRRRGDLDGAKARVAKLGYVRNWLVVGAFDNEGKGGFARKLGPEQDLADPLNVGRTYDGKERPVRWRAVTDVGAYGWVDFGTLVRPSAKVCVFASTFARDPRPKQAARPVSVWAGSAGAMRVWWNGEEVLADERYRDLDAERFGAVVTLREGWNRLTVKVCGDEDAPLLALRVGAADGGSDAHVETDANQAHATEAAAHRFRKPGVDAAPAARAAPAIARAAGPVPEMEARAKGGDAQALEAYARYLVATQSDDPAERKARQLATKAAQSAPTIPRLLLAGDLAENRNQRAEWIEKAEARVGAATPVDDRIAVLLARAGHLRGSANWRDAIPYYDRVLALDPDNVPATLARVELYGEAGLRETALAHLGRALDRRPRSVALLRAMVGALREVNRTTSANEVQDRYAQLRFDDVTYVRGQIDLAVARRDAAGASRWIDRLLATSPGNPQSAAAAAQALLQLGDRARAVAVYKRALDLAPEDTDTMRALAAVYSLGGQRDEQIKLLRRVLEVRPQDKEVREYVANTEPAKPRPDEAYARPSAEFLKLRDTPAAGFKRRTLVDLQVTTVFPNGLASRFRQVVFQPLTDAAAAEAREYAFGFEADTETVQLRGAKVYRRSGQVDEAMESGEGPADNPSIAMYTSARAFYVHFPRLGPGDVVELQYRVEDVAQRNAFADYFGEVRNMQDDEPLARAEYVLITPKARTFYFNKPSVPGLVQSTEEKGDQRVYRFVAENVPPIVPEALQPPYSELLGHVHVSTYKSWDEMGQWYWGLVKDQFTPDDEVRRRVTELTKNLKDERSKVKAVYQYVVQRTRYVALEFGIHGFKPYRCAQIFARGFGDCKDKATLIVTMLKELGIPATIVIVRTGHRGDFEREPASLAPFDHAIAYVPSLGLYLDGTAEYVGSNELPAMDRGAMALQVNEGKPKLVTLPDPPANESVLSRKVEATVGADGNATLDVRFDVTGVSASSWRERYHAEASRKQRLQEDLAGEFAGAEVGKVEANDLENVEEAVQLKAKVKVAGLARKDGDAMSIPAGPREHMVREYATLSQRRLDIRLGAQSTTDTQTVIKLPPGAKLTSAPKPASGTSPFGTFKVDVESGGGTVRVHTTIALTKSRILASEYQAFRAWCESVDRSLGQRVVFVK
jgi:tetratricopeptide (TPR) repeat protein/transglutaminase-like putative cysteine protease